MAKRERDGVSSLQKQNATWEGAECDVGGGEGAECDVGVLVCARTSDTSRSDTLRALLERGSTANSTSVSNFGIGPPPTAAAAAASCSPALAAAPSACATSRTWRIFTHAASSTGTAATSSPAKESAKRWRALALNVIAL